MKNLKNFKFSFNLQTVLIAAICPLLAYAQKDASSCIALKPEIQANPKLACIYYAAICPSLCSATGTTGTTGTGSATTAATTAKATTTAAATTKAGTVTTASGATSGAAAKNCRDATTDCIVYAYYGFCNRQIGSQPPEYYKTLCPQSCKNCGGGSTTTGATATTTIGTPPPP